MFSGLAPAPRPMNQRTTLPPLGPTPPAIGSGVTLTSDGAALTSAAALAEAEAEAAAEAEGAAADGAAAEGAALPAALAAVLGAVEAVEPLQADARMATTPATSMTARGPAIERRILDSPSVRTMDRFRRVVT